MVENIRGRGAPGRKMPAQASRAGPTGTEESSPETRSIQPDGYSPSASARPITRRWMSLVPS